MSKERIELSQDEKSLLQMSAVDLIPMLENDTNLSYVKEMAFQHYCEKTKEFFEVQVLVTRNTLDFLDDPFSIEKMYEVGSKNIKSKI